MQNGTASLSVVTQYEKAVTQESGPYKYARYVVFPLCFYEGV
jgi:hypothetical protein